MRTTKVNDMTHYLAADNELPKGIVGLIIFAIWVISAIAGGIKKRNQARPMGSTQPGMQQPSALEAFQRQVAQRLQEVQRQMQTPLPPFPPPGGVPVSNRQRIQAQQQQAASVRQAKRVKQNQQQQQRKRKSPPPPIPQRQQAQAVAVEEVPPIEAVQPPSARPQAPSVNADVIAKWMKPATLRQQFIITEIFQPPLSMREGR